MKSYIINLKRDTARRERMNSILADLPYIKYEYVDAIDARELDDYQISKEFDIEGFKKRYIRFPEKGEMGCSLSHRKCYEYIINSNDDYALVMEDDIVIKQDVKDILDKLHFLYSDSKPTIVLLSGWYWFDKELYRVENLKIRRVVDGFLAQSYIINRKAAEMILKMKPNLLADDWLNYHRSGIKIYGLYPVAIEQNWEDLESSIGKRNKLIKTNLLGILRIYTLEIKRKLMKLCGLYQGTEYHEKKR